METATVLAGTSGDAVSWAPLDVIPKTDSQRSQPAWSTGG
jgi:hypothetical protein